MDSTKVKHKSEGAKHCCFGTCNSDSRYRHRDEMKGVFFIPFPKPITRRETCEKWIKACGRPAEDFNVQKIKRCTYICSKHFVGEKGPTSEHPDPIAALLHTEEQVKSFQMKRKASTQGSNPVKLKKEDVTSAAEGLIKLSKVTTLPAVNNSTVTYETSKMSSNVALAECYALRLKPGEELKTSLLKFVTERGLAAAFVVTCVGSVTTATLRMANSTTIQTLDGPFEIVSLVGTLSGGGHLHASLSDKNGTVVGGHVVGDFLIYTTAEVVIGNCPNVQFSRELDKDTGYDELVVTTPKG